MDKDNLSRNDGGRPCRLRFLATAKKKEEEKGEGKRKKTLLDASNNNSPTSVRSLEALFLAGCDSFFAAHWLRENYVETDGPDIPAAGSLIDPLRRVNHPFPY